MLFPVQHTRIFGASAPGAGLPLHKTLMATPAHSITMKLAGSALRVTCVFASDTTLKHRVSDGTTTKDGLLREGATFLAGCEYSFLVPTISRGKVSTNADEVDLTHDFVCGSNVAVDLFVVEEIQEATS